MVERLPSPLHEDGDILVRRTGAVECSEVVVSQ